MYHAIDVLSVCELFYFVVFVIAETRTGFHIGNWPRLGTLLRWRASHMLGWIGYDCVLEGSYLNEQTHRGGKSVFT